MASKAMEGQVAIELGGQTFFLKPTPNAIRAISQAYGSLRPLINRIEDYDYSVVEFVVMAGLSWMPANEQKELPDLIFAAGYTGCAGEAAEFLGNLIRGGRSASPKDSEGDEDEDAGEGEALGG